jgi:hypothetical protein
MKQKNVAKHPNLNAIHRNKNCRYVHIIQMKSLTTYRNRKNNLEKRKVNQTLEIN